MLNTYDTHGGLSGDNAQRRFAEADLAGVDRARTPFVLVFTHGPMYPPPSYRSPYRTPYRSLNLRLNGPCQVQPQRAGTETSPRP